MIVQQNCLVSLSLILVGFLFVRTLAITDDNEVSTNMANIKADRSRFPTECEVCRFFSLEFEAILNKSMMSNQVVEMGYSFDYEAPINAASRRRIKYHQSELLLVEALEGTCDRLSEYKVQRDETNSNRFGRAPDPTFSSLRKLVKKGVKVDIGIPYEMWDSPVAEILELKAKCYSLVERYDYLIEEWYFGDRELSIMNYLCRERILQPNQIGCLNDPLPKPIPPNEEEDNDHKPLANGDGSKGGVRIS